MNVGDCLQSWGLPVREVRTRSVAAMRAALWGDPRSNGTCFTVEYDWKPPVHRLAGLPLIESPDVPEGVVQFVGQDTYDAPFVLGGRFGRWRQRGTSNIPTVEMANGGTMRVRNGWAWRNVPYDATGLMDR